MAETLFIIIVIFVLGEYLFSRTLSYLNIRSWPAQLPEEARDIYTSEQFQKAKSYAKENYRFGLLSGVISLLAVLLMLFFEGFAWVDEWLREFTTNEVVLTLLFFGVLSLANGIISLPFSIYHTFVIEEKYGFNKTTPGTFIMDMLKGLLLGVIIGGSLLALVVWIFTLTQQWFWLLAWGIMSGFSIFFGMFYTSLIVPIFNKLTPLEDGELRETIEAYCKKVGFPLNDLYVMDASKRSSKANAYFSGLGPKKTIVLFDTLMKDYSKEELLSILAHEVGHFKKKHVMKGLILGVIQTGILLFIFGLLAGSPILAEALGAEQISFHLALIAFSFLYSPVSMLTGLAMNAFSRKNEYEADEFAAQTADAGALQEALKRLSGDNLSNLTPHPAYVFVHYSHPPLMKRLAALSDAAKKSL